MRLAPAAWPAIHKSTDTSHEPGLLSGYRGETSMERGFRAMRGVRIQVPIFYNQPRQLEDYTVPQSLCGVDEIMFHFGA